MGETDACIGPEFDNDNVETQVTARSAGSTVSGRVIAEQDMILVEGYIGPENSPLKRPARVYIERANANIPAMQHPTTGWSPSTWTTG